jgi:hypothetical protein
MSSELERRLEGLFAEAPEPEAGAGDEALHRALHALHPAAPARRGIRTAVVAFATAAVLLAIAAGSLAAAGALHVSFGSKPKPKQRSTTSQLVLPQGASGVTAIVDGRLSVVTTGGFRLQGLPVTSAALSPHALFVAAGIGQSLVALKPSGRQAWSHPARGKVVAIAWAPFGNRIAYIIQIGHRLALHVIWGDGTHDTTIDRRVRAVRPSWRADSLAFAYVGAGGKAIVYDVGHRNRSILAVRAPVTGVAFAPAGRTLALSTPGSATVGGKTVATGEIEALGWQQDGRLEVALEMGVRPALVATFERNGRPLGGFRVPGRVVAITSGLVVTHTQNRIVAGWRRSTAATILRVSPAASVDGLEIG